MVNDILLTLTAFALKTRGKVPRVLPLVNEKSLAGSQGNL